MALTKDEARTKVKQRTEGATSKVYEVTNNFETYLTLEPPSQDYQNAYVAHWVVTLKQPLTKIKFAHKEITVFVRNTRVNNYKLDVGPSGVY